MAESKKVKGVDVYAEYETIWDDGNTIWDDGQTKWDYVKQNFASRSQIKDFPVVIKVGD